MKMNSLVIPVLFALIATCRGLDRKSFMCDMIVAYLQNACEKPMNLSGIKVEDIISVQDGLLDLSKTVWKCQESDGDYKLFIGIVDWIGWMRVDMNVSLGGMNLPTPSTEHGTIDATVPEGAVELNMAISLAPTMEIENFEIMDIYVKEFPIFFKGFSFDAFINPLLAFAAGSFANFSMKPIINAEKDMILNIIAP